MQELIIILSFTLLIVSVISCDYEDDDPLIIDGIPVPCATNASLTIDAAVCPEVVSDLNRWYLADYYKKIPRCFGIQPIPKNTKKPEDLLKVCRSKHPDAVPASIHNANEIHLLNAKAMTGSLIGLYIPSSRHFAITNLKNFDSTPVDYTPVNLVTAEDTTNVFSLLDTGDKPSLGAENFKKYIDSCNATVVCVLNATPRNPIYYRLPPNPIVNISSYTCEGDGWQLTAPCGGPPSCYRLLDLKLPGIFKDYPAEFNYCGMYLPNSYAADIQCEMEDVFFKSQYANYSAIGLYTPHRAWLGRYSNWVYGEGRPFWWAHRDPFQPGITAYNVVQDPDFLDVPSSRINRAICKKPAIPRIGPLPVPPEDTFLLNGKHCRKEEPSHWNRRCPTDRDDWALVESPNGVFCFATVETKVTLTPKNFNDKLCKPLHENAKLASFHHDIQLGVATSFLNEDFVVGLVYKNRKYQWSDGTPVNESFWAPGEPKHNYKNVVAKLKMINHPIANCSCVNRGALQTFYMDSLPQNQRIACKIEAEPLIPCAPLIKHKPEKTLNNTSCDDESWSKQRVCGNVYCSGMRNPPGEIKFG